MYLNPKYGVSFMNSKKVFIVFFLSGISPTTLHADTSEPVPNNSTSATLRSDPPKIEYGVRLGINSSTLVGENASSTVGENRQAVGFVGGAFSRLRISDWFHVQPELLFSRKGTDFELDGMDDGGLYFWYLELPALARAELPWKATLPRGIDVHPYVFGGPWVSLLVSAKSVSPGFGSRSIKDGIKDFDFGVTLGLGVAAEPVWWGAVELSARYVFGIPQIGDTEDGRDDAKHRTVSIMLGFRCCAHRKKARPAPEEPLPEPGDIEPAEPGDGEPAEPTDSKPDEPAETQPGEPADGESDEPDGTVPGEPIGSM